MEAALPGGTVTFLFTDIEGSTRLWEQYPHVMREAIDGHNLLLHSAISGHRGWVFKTVGDGFCAAFAQASDALAAACHLQIGLFDYPWPDVCLLRARAALHTGEADPERGDYLGPALNRVARLLVVGHGGQTLLSRAAYDRLRGALPEGAQLRELGAHRLKDIQEPEVIFQLLHPRLPADFPPLRSSDALNEHMPTEAAGFIGQEREAADGRGIAVFLEGLAREAGVRGYPERAVHLFGAAASLRETLGAPRPLTEREDYEEHVTAAAAQIDPAAFAAAWTEGWGMTLEQAIACALAEAG